MRSFFFALSILAAAAAFGAVGAQAAQPMVARSIDRTAAAQARVASDVAHGRISPGEAAAVEANAADVDRTVANLLVTRPEAGGKEATAAERDLDAHVADAERAHRSRWALERTHARVAATRDAEQQRRIAQGLRSGRLNAVQAAQLERAQATIAAMQADLMRRGGTTVGDALRMQHLQDVQDWAIHTGHEPGTARA